MKIELKVGSKSVVHKVAGSIAKHIDEGYEIELHAIGAGAVNQASKAIATARGYVAPSGKNLKTVIAFSKVELEGEEKTLMKFILEY